MPRERYKIPCASRTKSDNRIVVIYNNYFIVSYDICRNFDIRVTLVSGDSSAIPQYVVVFGSKLL
jgi:hypothetical protein